MGEPHALVCQAIEIGAGEAWIAQAMHLVRPKLVQRNQNDIHRRRALAAEIAGNQPHRRWRLHAARIQLPMIFSYSFRQLSLFLMFKRLLAPSIEEESFLCL